MSLNLSQIVDLNQSKTIEQGNGLYGEVKKGSHKVLDKIDCAIKIMDLDKYYQKLGNKISEQERNKIFQDIEKRIKDVEVLKANANFTPYEKENFKKDNKFYIGMEFCNFNLIKYFNEKKVDRRGLDIGEIYDIFNQLNNIFRLMSDNNIVNGNIKLSNILVKKNNNRFIFKLTGFEIIPKLIKFTKKKNEKEICKYLPPEILENTDDDFELNQKTDLWSIGVIIYYLLFGKFPFDGQSGQEILIKIKENKIGKTGFFELDNLIAGLLTPDQEKRLTWDKYFNHEFFKTNNFWRYFNIIDKIGQSEFSSVYKVKSKNDDNKLYALKVVDFSKIEELEGGKIYKDKITKEIKEKIDKMKKKSEENPNNFVNIYDIYYTEKGINFIMELFELNLKKYIDEFKEPKATNVFELLVDLKESFGILERERIMIGDLKLENILLRRKNESFYIIKLSDFGLCPNLVKLKKKSSNVGNKFYLAPEADNYDTACDLWSLGIMIHYFRFKKFPFNENYSGDIGESLNSNFNLLLKELLEKDPKKRLNWEKYFNHKFFIDRDYKKYYDNLDEISSGAYYLIYKGTERRTGIEKVIKIINKDQIRKSYFDQREEIDEKIMDDLVKLLVAQTKNMKILENEGQNENTVKFFEYFNTKEEFAIIMEKCDSDLNNYFIHKRSNTFSFDEIKDLLNQLNKTFKIMDENNIIHGDLKLENILYKIRDDNKLLYKLTDIGGNVEFLELTENFLDKSQPEFTAPEVLSDNKLQSLSDLWSLGIIIYMLFFRKKPYEGNTKALVLENIKLNGQNSFSSSNNPDFDHLIRKLLTVNLNERLTWQQYFSHPFLVGGDCWKYYKDKKEIGKGPYYTVYGVKISDREESRAVKAIDLKKIKRGIESITLKPCTDEDLKPYIDDFIKETKNMELLLGNNNDKNAVIFYEYFQTKDEFCIVQELCDDSLNALSLKKKTFTVQEIYQILTQLNNPFGILHQNNISHKDLRLEKILIKKNEKGENIYKLTGLEFNRKVNELLRNITTAHDKYNAPEILRGEIANKSEEEINKIYLKADLWSLGVMIYLLYFGVFPYKGSKAEDILKNINNDNISRNINNISDYDLQDLVKKLLTKDKDKRIDWVGYFAHQFFSNDKKK